MLSWLAANGIKILLGAAVILAVAVTLVLSNRDGKAKGFSCASCAGCSGCAQRAGCAAGDGNGRK